MVIFNDIEGNRKAINENLILTINETQLENGRFAIECYLITKEVLTVDFAHQEHRDYIFDLICEKLGIN